MPPTLDYTGKLVLAPMVRVSELPLRALSLRYGADLVWGPEIVDKRLLASRCVENKELGTTDFVLEKDASKLTWRTAPELERARVVFQLGTADAELAVAAARMVAPYVAGIDVNSGCPKHFSVHSGMGSQLLYAPDKLVAILSGLVEHVGGPFGVAISVKIRVLETAQRTYELVSRLVRTGIRCLTVHCRTPGMRPRREPAEYEQLAEIARICREAGVACLVNGDIAHRGQLQPMVETYGVSGAMIARGAEANPSCFGGPELVPALQICREFLDLCVRYDFNVSHMKYNLTNMVSGRDALYQKFARAKTAEALDAAIREAEASQSEHGEAQAGATTRPQAERGTAEREPEAEPETRAGPSGSPGARAESTSPQSVTAELASKPVETAPASESVKSESAAESVEPTTAGPGLEHAKSVEPAAKRSAEPLDLPAKRAQTA